MGGDYPEWVRTNVERLALLTACFECRVGPSHWCRYAFSGGLTITLHATRLDAARQIFNEGVRHGIGESVRTVAQMHYRVPPTGDPTGDPDDDTCHACEVSYPCPTMMLAATAGRPAGHDDSVTALLIGGPMDGDLRHVSASEAVLVVVLGDATSRYLLRVANGRPRLDKHGFRRFDWQP